MFMPNENNTTNNTNTTKNNNIPMTNMRQACINNSNHTNNNNNNNNNNININSNTNFVPSNPYDIINTGVIPISGCATDTNMNTNNHVASAAAAAAAAASAAVNTTSINTNIPLSNSTLLSQQQQYYKFQPQQHQQQQYLMNQQNTNSAEVSPVNTKSVTSNKSRSKNKSTSNFGSMFMDSNILNESDPKLASHVDLTELIMPNTANISTNTNTSRGKRHVNNKKPSNRSMNNQMHRSTSSSSSSSSNHSNSNNDIATNSQQSFSVIGKKGDVLENVTNGSHNRMITPTSNVNSNIDSDNSSSHDNSNTINNNKRKNKNLRDGKSNINSSATTTTINNNNNGLKFDFKFGDISSDNKQLYLSTMDNNPHAINDPSIQESLSPYFQPFGVDVSHLPMTNPPIFQSSLPIYDEPVKRRRISISNGQISQLGEDIETVENLYNTQPPPLPPQRYLSNNNANSNNSNGATLLQPGMQINQIPNGNNGNASQSQWLGSRENSRQYSTNMLPPQVVNLALQEQQQQQQQQQSHAQGITTQDFNLNNQSMNTPMVTPPNNTNNTSMNGSGTLNNNDIMEYQAKNTSNYNINDVRKHQLQNPNDEKNEDNPGTSAWKRARLLERNRIAASKCRQRKKVAQLQLQKDFDSLTKENAIIHKKLNYYEKLISKFKKFTQSHFETCHSSDGFKELRMLEEMLMIDEDIHEVNEHGAVTKLANNAHP